MIMMDIFFTSGKGNEMYSIDDENIAKFIKWYYSRTEWPFCFVSPEKDKLLILNRKEITHIEIKSLDKSQTVDKFADLCREELGK